MQSLQSTKIKMSTYILIFLIPFFLIWGVANDLFFDGGEAMTIVYTIFLIFAILLFICSALFVAMGGEIAKYIEIHNKSGYLLSNIILIPIGILKDLGKVAVTWVKGHTMSAIVLAFTISIMVGLSVLYDDKSIKKQFHVTGSFDHYKWIKVPPSSSNVFTTDDVLILEKETVVDILIVGGGGAGGGAWSGGGGGGEVKILKNHTLKAGTYDITVGVGGLDLGVGSTSSSIIDNSSDFSVIAGGGVHGRSATTNNLIAGGKSGNGKSGGKGNPGRGSGGGGGSSAVGGDSDGWAGGPGGSGTSNTFETGTPKQYGGGGGGGTNSSNKSSGKGIDGGGDGSNSSNDNILSSTPGKANTGGGGGGGTWRGVGSPGGSGIVVVKFSGNGIIYPVSNGEGQRYYELDYAFDNTCDVTDSNEGSFGGNSVFSYNNMPVIDGEIKVSTETCGEDDVAIIDNFKYKWVEVPVNKGGRKSRAATITVANVFSVENRLNKRTVTSTCGSDRTPPKWDGVFWTEVYEKEDKEKPDCLVNLGSGSGFEGSDDKGTTVNGTFTLEQVGLDLHVTRRVDGKETGNDMVMWVKLLIDDKTSHGSTQLASSTLENQNERTVNSGFLGVYVYEEGSVEASGEAQMTEAVGLWSLKRMGTKLQIRKDNEPGWDRHLFIKVKVKKPDTIKSYKWVEVPKNDGASYPIKIANVFADEAAISVTVGDETCASSDASWKGPFWSEVYREVLDNSECHVANLGDGLGFDENDEGTLVSGVFSLEQSGRDLYVTRKINGKENENDFVMWVKIKDKPLQVMNIIGKSIKQKEVTLSGYGKKAIVTPFRNGGRFYEVKIACEHVYKKWLDEANKSKAGKISLAVNENPKRECTRTAARDKLQRWGIVFLVYAIFMLSTSG